MQCPECRSGFEPHRSDQSYCSAVCNKKAGARELARARRIYRALYHWRLEHKTFGENMRFVCREVAAWIREDREFQRLPPPPHDHGNDRGHERAPRPVQLVRGVGGGGSSQMLRAGTYVIASGGGGSGSGGAS